MVNHIKKESSLLMCTTPLQMLISSKIIDLFPEQSFDLILIASSESDKYNKYYHDLSKKCESSIFFYKKENYGGLFLFFKYKMELNNKNMLKKYNNYYLASIDSRFFQYNLSNRFDFSKIYTFDDGSANIIRTSLYYNDYKPNLFKKIVLSFLGVNVFSKDIKEKSSLHFTIYKNIPNIIQSVYYIPLLGVGHNEVVCENNIVRFFLGQPFHDLIEEIDSGYINNVLNVLGITHYYPHPKENYIISSVDVVNSELIFEDYISDFIKNNKSKVEVYTFTSSAALNILGIEGIDVKFVFDHNIDLRLGFYKQISVLLNLEIVDWVKK